MPNRIVIDKSGPSPIEIRRTFLRLPIDRYAAPNDRPSLGFISTKANGRVFEIEVLIDHPTKKKIDALYVAKTLITPFQLEDDTLDIPTTSTVVFNSPPSYDQVGRLWQANLSFFEIQPGAEVVIDTISIAGTFLKLPVERFASPTDRPSLGFVSTVANGKIFEIEALITDAQKTAIDALYVSKNLTGSFELNNKTVTPNATSTVVFNAPPSYERVGQFWQANLSFFEIGAGKVTVDGTEIFLISELPLSVLLEFGTPITRSVRGNRIVRDISFANPRVFTIVGFVNSSTKNALQNSFNSNRYLTPIVINDQIDTMQTYNAVWTKPPEFQFVQVGVWKTILSLETA